MKKIGLFRSTVFRIFAIIIVIVLPVNIIALFFAHMISVQSRQILTAEIQNALDMGAANLQDDCMRLTKRLTYLSFSNEDMAEFARCTDAYYTSRKSRLMRSVVDTITEVRQEYSTIDIVYIQFPINGYTLNSGSVCVDKDTYVDVVNQVAQEKMKFGRCYCGRSSFHNDSYGGSGGCYPSYIADLSVFSEIFCGRPDGGVGEGLSESIK